MIFQWIADQYCAVLTWEIFQKFILLFPFLLLPYSSSPLSGCSWRERIEGRNGEFSNLSYLHIAIAVPTPQQQLLGTYAGEERKSVFVGLNVPCFIIIMLYCVYCMSVGLKACCTATLALCVISPSGPFNRIWFWCVWCYENHYSVSWEPRLWPQSADAHSWIIL